ncbi:hypothetical protein DRQ36_07780, partial [bacterium]
ILVLILFGSFIFSDKLLFGTDYSDLGHFQVKFYRNYVREFKSFPLWEPHLHGGMPFVEGMHGGIFFPLSVPIRLLLPPHRSYGFAELLFVLLAGWFMYILLRHYKLRREACFLGSIAYMFAPLLISLIYAGHDGKMWVIGLFPLVFWLLERAMERKRFADFILFGLSYSLMILTAHPQMAYFASWLLGALFVFRLVRGIVRKDYRWGKTAVYIGLFVLAIALGVGISAIQLYPPFDYVGKYSVRTIQTEEKGIEFGNSWRMNMEDLVSTAFPDFVGIDLSGRQSYWGRNHFRINSMYVGMAVVILALAAIIALKRPFLYFLGGFSVFAITYSIGTQLPFFYLYYYFIPGVKKFRAPEMLFFTVVFASVVSLAFAVNAVLEYRSENQPNVKGKKKKAKNKAKSTIPLIMKWLLWLGLGFTVVLIILSVVGKPLASWWLDTAPNFQNVNIQAKQAALQRNFPIFLKSSWLALILSWVVIGLLFWRIKSQKIYPMLLIGSIAVILIADLWRIGKPFIVVENLDRLFPKFSVVDYLEKENENRGPFRTLCLPKTMGNTHLASFGLDAVSFSELHGNQLRWYDEFTGRHQHPQNIQVYPHFWDILNIEYILSPQPVALPNLEFVRNFDMFFLYRNMTAFPRAVAFYNWETVEHEVTLQKLKDPVFVSDSIRNYRNVLLIESDPGISQVSTEEIIPVSSRFGRIIDNRYDDFYVEINMHRDGLLFLSQNWYPAWHAEEKGEKLPLIRADYSFTAVPLKKGTHKVHFYYSSPRLNKSLAASLGSLGLSVVLLIVGLVLNKKGTQYPQKKQ